MPARLLSVDELAGPPVVGRYYLVPTVRYRWGGLARDWPVMGPRHEDSEDLAFPWHHYHVDIRFVPERDIPRRTARRYPEAAALDPSAAEAANLPLFVFGQAHPDPVRRRRLCRRSGHDYPRVLAGGYPTFRRLWRRFRGRPCGRDADGQLVCPHKGFKLGSLQPDLVGRVTCPLHGLVIDTLSGRVADDPIGEPLPDEDDDDDG